MQEWNISLSDSLYLSFIILKYFLKFAPRGPAAAGGSSLALTSGSACTLHRRHPLSLCVSFPWMCLGVLGPRSESTDSGTSQAFTTLCLSHTGLPLQGRLLPAPLSRRPSPRSPQNAGALLPTRPPCTSETQSPLLATHTHRDLTPWGSGAPSPPPVRHHPELLLGLQGFWLRRKGWRPLESRMVLPRSWALPAPDTQKAGRGMWMCQSQQTGLSAAGRGDPGPSRHPPAHPACTAGPLLRGTHRTGHGKPQSAVYIKWHRKLF